MRRIREKERQNGMKYCTFCKPTRVNAIYRTDGRLIFACEKHKDRLLAYDDDDEMSEADYQTWGKYV